MNTENAIMPEMQLFGSRRRGGKIIQPGRSEELAGVALRFVHST